MTEDVTEVQEHEHERVFLNDLKKKTPAELLAMAEELEVEGASLLSKQELMFGVLKELAERDVEIIGVGVVEVLPDGFGFMRSPQSNYLAGPDDIYVQPQMIRKMGLRTGDTVEGTIRGPRIKQDKIKLLRIYRTQHFRQFRYQRCVTGIPAAILTYRTGAGNSGQPS